MVLREKDIELPGCGGFAPADPEQLFAVGAEVREGVEISRVGEPLQASGIKVHCVEFEITALALAVLPVAGEDYGFAIRRKDRREGGADQVRQLPLPGAVSVHHPDIHVHGFHEVLFQEFAVLGAGRITFGIIGAPGDEL